MSGYFDTYNVDLIGCYLAYAGTRDLQTLVTQLFTTYGDMFALSLFSQKIVFIKNSKVKIYSIAYIYIIQYTYCTVYLKIHKMIKIDQQQNSCVVIRQTFKNFERRIRAK